MSIKFAITPPILPPFKVPRGAGWVAFSPCLLPGPLVHRSSAFYGPCDFHYARSNLGRSKSYVHGKHCGVLAPPVTLNCGPTYILTIRETLKVNYKAELGQGVKVKQNKQNPLMIFIYCQSWDVVFRTTSIMQWTRGKVVFFLRLNE